MIFLAMLFPNMSTHTTRKTQKQHG